MLDIDRLLSHIGLFEKPLISADDCFLGGVSFPAVAAPARAFDGRIDADNHMTEFARRAFFAAIYLPVENYARADAFGNQNGDKISCLADFFVSEPKLGERDRVGVVSIVAGSPVCSVICAAIVQSRQLK